MEASSVTIFTSPSLITEKENKKGCREEVKKKVRGEGERQIDKN
jgi:hypothetical protein